MEIRKFDVDVAYDSSVRYTVLMVKKTTVKTHKKTDKVEKFEPTKMSLAVSAAAAAVLVLFAVVATYL